jgi:hypothetical protein
MNRRLCMDSRNAAGESGFAGCPVPVDRSQRRVRQARRPATTSNGSRRVEKSLRLSSDATEGNVMRYLKLIIFFLACAVITPAFAQVCCPSGCSQDSNRCVYNGTQNTCPRASCSGSSSGSSGGSGGQSYQAPGNLPPPPPCIRLNPTKARRDAATDACVNALTANAQFWGCLFEDDAGRAEDQKTGLSCPARQAALANHCRSRCAGLALAANSCTDPNTAWQAFFGDISGEQVGSAPCRPV